MSAFRGILTGYLGAKIADTEAADRLKGEVLASASKDLLTNILPEQRAAEELRRKNYNNLASMYNPNIAELGDINDFTRDEASMEKFENFLKKNKLKNPEAFKNLQFETDFNTRYDQRGIAFNEKFQPLLKQIGIDQQGGMGFYTIKNQLSEPGQTDQTMEQPGQTPEAPQEFASTQLSDYFVTSPISYDIPESEFQKVASTMREFGQFFTQDERTGELKVNLNETNRNEYGALRNITQEIAQNYLDQDGKVNVSAAMTAGSNILTKQTTDVIYGRQRADGFDQGIAAADGNDFSQNFDNTYKTDKAKKEYLVQGLFNLDGGQEAQRYFAQSFPETVLFDDNTSVRDYLLKLTGLKR